MTERARREWAAALRRALAANDAFIMSDWDAAGLEPGLTGYYYNSEPVLEPLLEGLPPTQPSDAEKRLWLGSCKQIKPADAANLRRVQAMRQQGLIPEYFPSGHEPWLLAVITHPQMVALQRRLLNSVRARSPLRGAVPCLWRWLTGRAFVVRARTRCGSSTTTC